MLFDMEFEVGDEMRFCCEEETPRAPIMWVWDTEEEFEGVVAAVGVTPAMAAWVVGCVDAKRTLSKKAETSTTKRLGHSSCGICPQSSIYGRQWK